MSWTAPATWVAAAVLTAAQLNEQVRDNLLELAVGITGWVDYSGSVAWTVSTSGTITDTVNYAKYAQVGKTVFYNVSCTVDSVSSPVGNHQFSLPVTAASSAAAVWGSGWLLDAGGSDVWVLAVTPASTSIVIFRHTSTSATAGVITAAAPFAIATSDQIGFGVVYEAA